MHVKLAGAVLLLFLLLEADCFASRPKSRGRFGDTQYRRQAAEGFLRKSRMRKQSAEQIAQRQGWETRGQVGEHVWELMAIEGDRVYVYQTRNENSAISIAVDSVRNVLPYSLNGADWTVGFWDGGMVRQDHQEFGGRVTLKESASTITHATHVAGTLGAAGVVISAMGMAPNVYIDSYEFNDDTAEMALRAMSYADEPGKVSISNHSYGYIAGWEYSSNPPRWYGTWGYRESDFFGIYDGFARDWDVVCYEAPYYLVFNAVGNDRDDKAPTNGTVFEYYSGRWRTATYDSSIHPYDDGWDNGGFDTIPTPSMAKNILTVGAVDDAVSDGMRDVSKATMPSFSCWGPTDDGRIKPDIVTDGVSIYSCTATSSSSYGTMNGTSTACPAATGGAVLLSEYYGELFDGAYMRSSTLKGLIIHTSDDLGNPGPDYKFGWGLMNVKAAADLILLDRMMGNSGRMIVEDVLDSANPVREYKTAWLGTGPIKITMCWTDPAGNTAFELDDPTPRLVNDLDIRVISPDSLVTYYPFILNPSTPDEFAVPGDNIVDNVEQVYVDLLPEIGLYRVVVSHKGILTDGEQNYSLILNNGVIDEERPHHFEWSSFNFVQYVDEPFDVTVSAKDVFGQIDTRFEGTVSLSGKGVSLLSNDANEVDIEIWPEVSDSFVDGQWTGQMVVLEPAEQMRLYAGDANNMGSASNVFTVGCVSSGPAYEPVPADGAVDVPLNIWLSWQTGGGGVSGELYDVYFGKVNPPTELICEDWDQIVCEVSDPNAADPNSLGCSTTYYWQVIVDGNCGIFEGPVWSFTTGPAGDFDDDCAVGMVDFGILAEYWNRQDCLEPEWCSGADVDQSGGVGTVDLAIMAGNWLKE